MTLKNLIRSVLIFFHLDLTKNLKYDRLTNVILKRVIKPGTNCIDIGCHKGEILEIMLHCSPGGTHFAFEPIPYLFNNLVANYGKRATIYPYALAEQSGQTTFNLVKNAPAYSGLKQRRYDIANPDIEEINVEIRKLDELIPADVKIGLVKIDVEGAEFGVLKGGVELIKRDKPIIIFECGLGGSDYYGTTSADMFTFMQQTLGMGIYTLSSFIGNKPAMTANEFDRYFSTNAEYYFVAKPV